MSYDIKRGNILPDFRLHPPTLSVISTQLVRLEAMASRNSTELVALMSLEQKVNILNSEKDGHRTLEVDNLARSAYWPERTSGKHKRYPSLGFHL
jgi:hypothetical protein